MRVRDTGEAFTLNIKGKLFSLAEPQVMGILNVTPDSFYAGSRCRSEEAVVNRAKQIVSEGGTMIDVGAYSTRPDAAEVTPQEEMQRLAFALPLIREAAPEAVVSVDTFRADVARMCVEQYGADVINDVSGGTLDDRMFETVADLRTPYILMHMRGTPKTMQQMTDYGSLLTDVMKFFAERIETLHLLGVHDIIVDPGFGFAKTLEQNYQLYAHLADFALLDQPLLVGISRKSMIYKLLGTDAERALNGTTVLNTLALQAGTDILRVHDVRAAVEAVKIVGAVNH